MSPEPPPIAMAKERFKFWLYPALITEAQTGPIGIELITPAAILDQIVLLT